MIAYTVRIRYYVGKEDHKAVMSHQRGNEWNEIIHTVIHSVRGADVVRTMGRVHARARVHALLLVLAAGAVFV